MRFSDIKPGTKLEITLNTENGKIAGPVMASEIEKVMDEDNILIAAPFYHGILYPLQVSSSVKINLCGEDAMYSFRGIVTERVKLLDNLDYITINRQGEIRKIQRREFFRFDCILDIRYRAIEPEDVLNETTDTVQSFYESYTTDISGGGLCFISNEAFVLKQLIDIQIDIGGGWTSFKGKVVRIVANEKGKTDKFKIGVSFIDIRERDRQKIIEFIFKQQRNLREKGLI